MVTHAIPAPPVRETLLDAWDNLGEESRALLARFIAFLEQEEADREERLIMADPELAASIRAGQDRFHRRDFSECKRLEEAFADDL